ncbi:MAG: hypothetical protein KC548_01080, partial [Nanoarchaeota archaeon]|nr:hypothetical protein [Nanoarchaeota archaeon]
ELNIDKKYLNFINEILEQKEKSNEKTKIENSKVISSLIEDLFQEIESLTPKETGDKTELMRYLNEIAIQIKIKAYLK